MRRARNDGPFYQERRSDGRYGRRVPHHCSSSGHGGRSGYSSGEMGAAAGLGALIAFAGVALYRWVTGTPEGDAGTSHTPDSSASLQTSTSAPYRGNTYRSHRRQVIAQHDDAVATHGRAALELYRRANSHTSMDAVTAASLLEELARELRSMESAAREAHFDDVRVRVDPAVWSALMDMRRTAAQSCKDLKRRAMESRRHDFPRFSPAFHSDLDDRTTLLLSETAHQMEHAMKLSHWVAETGTRELSRTAPQLPAFAASAGLNAKPRQLRNSADVLSSASFADDAAAIAQTLQSLELSFAQEAQRLGMPLTPEQKLLLLTHRR